ncbi:MAG: DUF2752 domain-containing protein [Clostridiales bacterium]|nr:DUF2752 domain-containing protein [Clostridiales bacterium]
MEQTEEKKSYRLCQISWCLIALAGLGWLWLQVAGISPERLIRLMPPCVFRSMVGLYCPGCGGTRAVLELLRGHILQSVWYHPIVVYAAGLYGWYLISNTIEWLSGRKIAVGSRYHRWYGTGAAVLVIVNCLLRNLLLLVFHITL